MTVNEIFDMYIEHISNDCSTNTVVTYQQKLNVLVKYLRVLDATDVSFEEARRTLDDLTQQYKLKTVRNILNITNAAFKYAIEKGIILENPFATITLASSEPYKPLILTEYQLDHLLKSVEQDINLCLPVMIVAETGLTRSQVLALTWKDIDFSESKISVSKNVIRSKEHKFSGVKIHQTRKVQMSNHLAEILLGVKNYRRTIGIGVDPDDYVCLTSSYKAMEPTYFNKLFKKFVTDTDNIPNTLRLQDIRWTYIVNEVKNRNDPLEVAKKVGHKNCVYTMDSYYRLQQNIA